MKCYEPPALIASYSIEELRAEAAACASVYPSDLALKSDVQQVEGALIRLGRIRTTS
jgi:hypothetical protein